MKTAFLDKLIERLDKLDPQSLHTQFLRLIREKGLLEAVFNAIHEGIIVLDGQGRITYANNAAGRLLGFTPETAIREPMARFLKDIEWDRILNLDEQAWSNLIGREIEVSYPERKFLNFYVMPIDLRDDQERGAVVILRDVTRDREKELNVMKSEHISALTLLAAGVAHELGNPLNSLHIHLQLMERELQRLPPQARPAFQELLTVANNEMERLHHTITQFLRAIRPTPPQREPCRVEDLLDETLAFMKPEIENQGIVVHLKCPAPSPQVSLDRNQIKQAFFNVIKNSLQAMANGGLLTITVSGNERFVGVAFRDTGGGIPAEDLGALFEPYRTTKPRGTGLGLMIVQRIVQDHGGQIEVHNQPNVGMTFTMLLPLNEQRVRLLKAPRRSRGRRKTERRP